MKFIKTILVLTLFTMQISCTAQNDKDNGDISGRLEDGLRILSVDSGDTDLNYRVYRGDYIVFDFEENGSYEFEIPSLEISEFMPKPETEKSYVKMKKSGLYPFTLGQRRGTIKVVELEEPHYKELSAQEASDLLANTDPLIIDVRTEGEYTGSHIAGAELLPVQILSVNLDQLEPYKNQDIFLYCQSGNRSTVASKILLDAGFTKIYNLRNGIGDWIRKGFPVE